MQERKGGRARQSQMKESGRDVERMTDRKIKVDAQVLIVLQSIFSVSHLQSMVPGYMVVNDTSPLFTSNDKSEDGIQHTQVPCL